MKKFFEKIKLFVSGVLPERIRCVHVWKPITDTLYENANGVERNVFVSNRLENMTSNFLLDSDANQKLYVLIESLGMLFWEAAKDQIVQTLEDKYGHEESLKSIIADIKKV